MRKGLTSIRRYRTHYHNGRKECRGYEKSLRYFGSYLKSKESGSQLVLIHKRCFGSNATIAKSLKDASKRPESIETLLLEGSTKDLKCVNVFCEAAGGPCICRLSRWIEQTKPRLSKLRRLSLRGAKLGKLPESLFLLDCLEELDLRDNDLTELSENVSNLTRLKKLRLEGNQIDVLPEAIRDIVEF